MKPLSREAIERVLGKQPPLPAVAPPKEPQRAWSAIGRDEARAIFEFHQQNPTYSMKELAKKFNRSPSAICATIKKEAAR